MKTRVSAGWAAVIALLAVTAQGSGIHGIHGGMPNRIWMHVAVAKQTQVRTVAPAPVQKLEVVLGFSVQAGVLKASHDIALNAIRNLK